MKRVFAARTLSILLAAAFGAGFTSTTFAAPPAASAQDDFAPGRILVQPNAGLPPDALAQIAASVGGKARKVGQSNLHIIDLPKNSEKGAVEKLKHNPHLKFAELDRKVKALAVPNDPYFGSEWHLNTIGAPAAWDVTQGAGVTIAILDSGVEGTHPDLVPNLVPGYNFYDNNTNTADVCGHGTAVAGTAAAASNNGIGVASVAGQAKIMPIRIAYFDTTANSCYGYYSTISSGLTYAADHGARIANVSYGGVAGSSSVISAAQYMKNKGGLVFVSAGNSGANEGYAATTSMIPVSATNQNDALFSWSSYGPYVALSAPGLVWTTSTGAAYNQWQGTSFASPVTAGVGALVMAANPALDNLTVENLLYNTAVDLGTAGRDFYFGYGRVNAAAAVQAALTATPAPAPDTTPPTVSITSPANSSSVSGIVPVSIQAADNVGVARVDLVVNGTVVASDSTAPFSFSWDSTGTPNGMANLVANAYDAAGNLGQSTTISVSVANQSVPIVDTTPPVVKIVNPVAGKVAGNVQVSTSASDNSGSAGISQFLYINGQQVAKGTGASLSYNWNTKKIAKGTYTIQATAKDKAGNTSSTSVQVTN
jgi:subtilisin family serine protease